MTCKVSANQEKSKTNEFVFSSENPLHIASLQYDAPMLVLKEWHITDHDVSLILSYSDGNVLTISSNLGIAALLEKLLLCTCKNVTIAFHLRTR